MSDKNPKKNKVQEPATSYKINQLYGIGKDFNFDEEFKKGLTLEEAKELSVKKIRSWWGK